MRSKYLYMLVTKDKYELPLIVEESPTELARKCGANPITVMTTALQAERGLGNSRYRRVKIDEGEEG